MLGGSTIWRYAMVPSGAVIWRLTALPRAVPQHCHNVLKRANLRSVPTEAYLRAHNAFVIMEIWSGAVPIYAGCCG